MVGPHASKKFSIYDGYRCIHYEKENGYYVYYNNPMVTIPKGCPARALENASPTRKRA